MRELGLQVADGERLRVLALGCHSDDIEIGAGGTLMRLLAAHPALDVHWVVFSAHGARVDEARASAEDLLAGSSAPRVDVHGFRDGYFPYDGAQVKDVFEALKDDPAPDLILTHHRQDLHQDHRLVCELTWNTFRDHVVLEYEIPKWDGDLGAARPQMYWPVPAELVRRKYELLAEHYPSQHGHDWFREDTFSALARLRGMECREDYAEAFGCPQLVLTAGRQR